MKRITPLLLAIACVFLLLIVPLALCSFDIGCCDFSAVPVKAISLAICAGLMGMTYQVGDYELRVTRALPGSATNVTSTGIDLGHTTNGRDLTDKEFLVEAPALTTSELPDSQTITYAVVTSASSNMSSPTIVNASLLVQTGAGGAGADAAEARFRLPSNCQRYVALKATKSGAGSAATATAVLSIKF